MRRVGLRSGFHSVRFAKYEVYLLSGEVRRDQTLPTDHQIGRSKIIGNVARRGSIVLTAAILWERFSV